MPATGTGVWSNTLPMPVVSEGRGLRGRFARPRKFKLEAEHQESDADRETL